MSTIVTRAGKGSPLTHTEVDNNFTNLNTDKYQSGNNASFGTLAATGVATFSAGTVSAPAITTTGDTNTGIFFPAADTIAFTEGGVEAMRIDSSGNVGIGVAPSAWSTVVPALQIGGGGAFLAALGTSPYVALGTNAHYNGSNFVYRTTNTASYYDQSSGLHRWYTAPSGTAGTNVTFTQAMTLDASGNVLIGTTSAATSSTLNVVGTGYQPIYVNTTISGGGGAAFSRSGTQAMYVGTAGSSWLTGSSTADGLMRSEANMLFAVGNTERMRIDSSGNVGIGTTTITSGAGWTPTLVLNATGAALVVKGVNGQENSFGNSNGLYIDCLGNSTATNNNLIFRNTNVNSSFTALERMRITSSGHVLIGTTDTSTESGIGFKYIPSTTAPYTGVVKNTDSNSTEWHLYNTNATNNGYRFYVGANGGIYNYSANNINLSDERTKENIELAGNYLDKICSIPVKTFNYKDEPTGEQKTLGVIAQDVELIAPEFVNNDGWKGTEPEDGVPLKTIYTTDMMFGLMKAIQELKTELDTVKAELQTLKGN